MTHKAIHYSNHALRRMRVRGISRQQVKWLVARGTRTPAWTPLAEQRWQVLGYLGRREAVVIFVEYTDYVLVITVAWIEKQSAYERRGRKQRKKKKGR